MPRFSTHQCSTCQQTFKSTGGLRSHQRTVGHLPSSRLSKSGGILPAPSRPLQPKLEEARSNSLEQNILIDLISGKDTPDTKAAYDTIVDTIRQLIEEHRQKKSVQPGLQQSAGELYADSDPDDLILDFLDSLLNDEPDTWPPQNTNNNAGDSTSDDESDDSSTSEDEQNHDDESATDVNDTSFMSFTGIQETSSNPSSSSDSGDSSASDNSNNSSESQLDTAAGDMSTMSLNVSIIDELDQSMQQLDISAALESGPNQNSPTESLVDMRNVLVGQDLGGGTRTSKHWGIPIGRCVPLLERIHKRQIELKQSFTAPFADYLEFEFVKWLIEHDISQTARQKLLRAVLTRQRSKLSFKSNHILNRMLNRLPTAGPRWQSEKLTLTGDLKGPQGESQTEEVEIWMRNIVELIQELLENVTYGDKLVFSASPQFLDPDKKVQIYNEMWSGEWWIRMQRDWLPEGATLIPVILSSDATQLTDFVGGKKAWPVYLTLGNIPKDIRRKPSSYATLLLGYIPVAKLDCFSPDEASLEKGRLFHRCLRKMLKPLVEAGKTGVDMACGDGYVRRCYPVLAAYIADNPEQTMIACCRQNLCHKGLVDRDERGDYVRCPPRNHKNTAAALEAQTYEHTTQFFVDNGLKPFGIPFWSNLPHCDIFTCLTPDILHQLHKGVFKDHLMSWCLALVEDQATVNNRCKRLPTHSSLRHFSNGITRLKQTNAKEHREMEKIFTGVMAGLIDDNALMALNSAIDFIYYAQFSTHTTTTLKWLGGALARFHEYKDAFVKGGAREHFNINKVHSMLHYSDAIQELGSVDGFNTESPERFHIEYAKRAYRATNHIDFFRQMTEYLERRERVQKFDCYLRWAIPEYKAHMEAQENKQAARLEKLNSQGWNIAQKSPFKPISSDQLPTYFNVHFFDYALDQFLKVYWAEMGRSGPRPIWSPRNDRLTIYPKATQVINDQFQTSLIDIVHASPHQSLLLSSARAPARRHNAARFDTVLMTKDSAPCDRLAYGMDELDVSQVRLIFTLPPRFNVPAPLVFVHSFRGPRSTEPIKHTGMFRIKRLCYAIHDGGHPVGEIYTLDTIRRTCHLIPEFGDASPTPGPSQPPVLEAYEDFFLNRYLDLHSFQLIF